MFLVVVLMLMLMSMSMSMSRLVLTMMLTLMLWMQYHAHVNAAPFFQTSSNTVTVLLAARGSSNVMRRSPCVGSAQRPRDIVSQAQASSSVTSTMPP